MIKPKIHFTHSDGTEDWFYAEGDTYEEIQIKVTEELERRGGYICPCNKYEPFRWRKDQCLCHDPIRYGVNAFCPVHGQVVQK